MLVGSSFNADLIRAQLERGGNVRLHLLNMRIDLGVLGNDGRVHVDERALSLHHLPLRFLQEHTAGRIAPSWIRVGEKVSYVRLSERAKHRITNRVGSDGLVCI